MNGGKAATEADITDLGEARGADHLAQPLLAHPATDRIGGVVMSIAVPGYGPAHRRHKDEVEQVMNGPKGLRGRGAEIEHQQPAPGRSTRRNWRRAFSRSATLRRP